MQGSLPMRMCTATGHRKLFRCWTAMQMKAILSCRAPAGSSHLLHTARPCSLQPTSSQGRLCSTHPFPAHHEMEGLQAPTYLKCTAEPPPWKTDVWQSTQNTHQPPTWPSISPMHVGAARFSSRTWLSRSAEVGAELLAHPRYPHTQ